MCKESMCSTWAEMLSYGPFIAQSLLCVYTLPHIFGKWRVGSKILLQRWLLKKLWTRIMKEFKFVLEILRGRPKAEGRTCWNSVLITSAGIWTWWSSRGLGQQPCPKQPCTLGWVHERCDKVWWLGISLIDPCLNQICHTRSPSTKVYLDCIMRDWML